MKRKISMLLALTLVATSFIACTQTTQGVDTTSSTQTQSSEPTSPNDMTEPEVSTPTPTAVPDFSDLYDQASVIFNQLSSSTLDMDFEQQAIIDESILFKVKDFSSFEELNTYLLTIFSREVIDELTLIELLHVEFEGELYGKQGDAPSNIYMGEEISREVVQDLDIATIKVEVETKDENLEVNGSEFFEFTCELIDDNWIFTSFPKIR